MRDWKYVLSVFLTWSLSSFLFNFAIQILFQFAMLLPNQSQALTIQGVFYDITSLSKSAFACGWLTLVNYIGVGFSSFIKILTSHFIGQNQLELAKKCIKKSVIYILIIGGGLSVLLFLLRHVLANLFFKGQPEPNQIFVDCITAGVFLLPFYLSIETVMSLFW